MELIVYMTGMLTCITLSLLLAVWVGIPTKSLMLCLLVFIVAGASSVKLYDEVIQEYFIGKRITTEQICTDVQKLELYWK